MSKTLKMTGRIKWGTTAEKIRHTKVSITLRRLDHFRRVKVRSAPIDPLYQTPCIILMIITFERPIGTSRHE